MEASEVVVGCAMRTKIWRTCPIDSFISYEPEVTSTIRPQRMPRCVAPTLLLTSAAMLRRLLSSILVAASLSCLFIPTADAALSYQERVREKILPNGLKVLLLEDHKAPVAVVQVWYRVGSRNEELGKTGLSHLLEHLMFKGTQKTGPEEYSKIIQRNGGNDNAFTSNDNTTYFAQIASDRIGVVIDLEADRMHNLSFDDAQFTPEHHVVIEERRLRTEDNPVSELFEVIAAAAYTAHPYQWPIVGWMSDLRQATREDALAYYRRHYTPSNAFVIAAGDFSSDALLAQIEAAFGPIKNGPPPDPVRAVEPQQQGERRTVLRRPAQLPFIALAHHVPNLESADAAALEVLSAVLSGGKSARLYKQLVYEKRIALDVGASFDFTSLDPGLFIVYGQPLPGKPVATLEKELLQQLKQVQDKPVSDTELTKAKNGIESAAVMAQDSQFYQAMLLGQYETAGDWKLIDEFLPRVRAVGAGDVQRVARTYLRADNRTVGILDPLPLDPTKRPPRAGVPAGGVH